jgi:hypothetical protein
MISQKTLFSFFLIITMAQTIESAQEPNPFVVQYIPPEYEPDRILVQGITPNDEVLIAIEYLYTSIKDGSPDDLWPDIEHVMSLYTPRITLDDIQKNNKTPLQFATEVYNYHAQDNQKWKYRNIIETLLDYGANPLYAPYGKKPYELNDEIFEILVPGITAFVTNIEARNSEEDL